jgi:hypothetical protein
MGFPRPEKMDSVSDYTIRLICRSVFVAAFFAAPSRLHVVRTIRRIQRAIAFTFGISRLAKQTAATPRGVTANQKTRLVDYRVAALLIIAGQLGCRFIQLNSVAHLLNQRCLLFQLCR